MPIELRRSNLSCRLWSVIISRLKDAISSYCLVYYVTGVGINVFNALPTTCLSEMAKAVNPALEKVFTREVPLLPLTDAPSSFCEY